KEQKIEIKSGSGLSEDEIKRMVTDAESHAEEDRRQRELAEARNAAENAAYQAERQLNELGESVDSSSKEEIEAAIKEVRDVLTSDDTVVPAGEPEAPVSPPAGESNEAAAPEADEHAVRRDLEELAAKAQKADEYLEIAQRTKADFENYRKRAARDAALAQERGVIKLVRELLPAVDNLDRAVAALNGGTSSEELASGVKLVHDELVAALNRAGVALFA